MTLPGERDASYNFTVVISSPTPMPTLRWTIASLLLLSLAACSKPAQPPPAPAPTPPVTTNAPASRSISWNGTVLTGKHTVVLQTNKGDIPLELDGDATPRTVTNFIALARSGYYDGLTFHRVISGFMIQGGDPSGTGTGGASIYGPTFEDEIKPNFPPYTGGYKAGTIAMANRGPNTNGSQFFIMHTDYPLPPRYTIFGHVTGGMDVVNAIATTPTDKSNDHPLAPVTFTVKVVN